MAIKTVKFTLNGQTYDLTYDSASGKYTATINAPSTTSWAQTDHKYPGTVTATDTAGNASTATKAQFATLALRVLEKVKPTITVASPTAGAYLVSSKPTIQWTVTDAESGINADTVALTIDGTAVASGITKTETSGGYACQYTPTSALSEGAHTLVFNVSDNDGNSAAAVSVTFTVDTVPPIMNLTAPTNNLVTNNKAVAFSGTTNDATSSPVTLKYTVNGGTAVSVNVAANGSFSGTITLPETDGEYTIEFMATDAAGKTTSVTRKVTLDTKAPVITAVTLTPNPVDAGATYIISVTVTD